MSGEIRSYRAWRGFVQCASMGIDVRSQRAGERIMQTLRRLYLKLYLRVNESKSAVAPVQDRKFLGYSLWLSPKNEVPHTISSKALGVMKGRVRRMTSRKCGRSLAQVCQDLRAYLLGWKAYSRLVELPSVFRGLDSWIRHRLSPCSSNTGKTGRPSFENCVRRACHRATHAA